MRAYVNPFSQVPGSRGTAGGPVKGGAKCVAVSNWPERRWIGAEGGIEAGATGGGAPAR
jgi:hypothetical protein